MRALRGDFSMARIDDPREGEVVRERIVERERGGFGLSGLLLTLLALFAIGLLIWYFVLGGAGDDDDTDTTPGTTTEEQIPTDTETTPDAGTDTDGTDTDGGTTPQTNP
jgi:cytoskeletal protein RodZ